jgi:hypothetical protein
MADIKDESNVIQATLAEIGVNGELDVDMGGEHVAKPIGHPAGDEMAVKVVIADKLDGPVPMHLSDGRSI